MNINGKEKVKIKFLLHKEELGPLPKKVRLPAREEKKVPQLGVHPLPTRETWKAAKEVDVKRKELEAMKRKANEALSPPHGAGLETPEKNHMRIELDWDMRNKRRAIYQAKIISDNGLIRAEVWGTKSGKARSFPGSFNDESDVDGLDAEGREQLKKALYVTRQIITKKDEYASEDDSAPESGSDTSDEE